MTLTRLKSLLAAERPTHVVNFAAQSMVGESWLHPDHWMMTNVVSAVRLHDLLRNYDALERYVHVTTPEVYGSTEGWIREDAPFNPSTPYAVSRAAADMSLRTYFANYRLPVVFTRAANVYGPGQQLYRIVPRTIVAAMTGQKLRLDGGGKSVRVFIHMSDVSDATLRIARKGTPGDTYHISGYELVSIRTLVESAHWSAADAVLIDEARDLIERTPSLAHVVVDEAQDLSPMECRALGRRCATGSATVLGDIAQGTTPWATARWEQMLDHLGKQDAGAGILDTGYRVPRQILDFASRLLNSIAPGLDPGQVRAPGPGLTRDHSGHAGHLSQGAGGRVRRRAVQLQ